MTNDDAEMSNAAVTTMSNGRKNRGAFGTVAQITTIAHVSTQFMHACRKHLFLETPEANLSAGMQYLNGSYTSYFKGDSLSTALAGNPGRCGDTS
jgi:hypothetical protein